MDNCDKTIRTTYWLWLLATTLMLLMLGAVAYNNRQQIEHNTRRIDDLIEARTKDRWTATDSKKFLDEFRKLNPTLIVPEPQPEFGETNEWIITVPEPDPEP